MLIRFSATNFLSFKDAAELSMVAGGSRRHKNHIAPVESSSDFRILKSGVIFGANASGKSNLVKAMSVAQKLVLHGLKSAAAMPTCNFRLSPDSMNEPTSFLFEVKTKLGCFEYAFAIDAKSVVSERLSRITKKSEKLIFERTRVNDSHKFNFEGIKFKSKSDEQYVEFTGKGTPANRLFLNEFKERGVAKEVDYLDSCNAVFDWFEHTLNIVFPNSRYSGLEIAMQRSTEASKTFGDILARYDTGVKSLELDRIDFPTGLDDIPEEIRTEVIANLEDGENLLISGPSNTRYQICKRKGEAPSAYKLMATHENSLGEEIKFDINEESDGTQRLIDMIPGLMEIISGEKVYVIDELDRSLHPAITHAIVSSFLDETVTVASQLIVTTHDSNLLDQDLLRKDEIWFTQKSAYGESTLYSLEEFQPRFDKDIRRGYLTGRLGGGPLLNS